MALTFGDFLSIFTTNDASGGRAIKATFDTGVDDAANYLTKSDPAGGRAIKVVNVGAPLGPQFWTEAYNSGTQATSSWTATGAATNINAAIVPKGTGALLAAIPDGTATGGNARGIYAVDFQMVRSAATQVASANYTTILGGRNNTNRSSDSVLVAGNNNIIWNHRFNGHGVIVGGQNNRIGNADSSTDGWNFIGGGINNSALALDSCVIVGGNGNTVGGFRSSVVGGASNNLGNNTQSCFIGGGESNAINSSVTSEQKGMVIVGGFSNTNTSQYGFIGAGQTNSNTSNQWSSIVGGLSNSITNSYAFIGGGQSNTASGQHAVVCGGWINTASNSRTFIGSGESNTNMGAWGVIGGGQSNFIGTNSHVAICGGQSNSAGAVSFVGGGLSNAINSSHGIIGGGQANTISAQWGTIAGGQQNSAGGQWATVGGGYLNTSASTGDFVGGGRENSSSGTNNSFYKFIGGGQNNLITGEQTNHCVITGGSANTINTGRQSVIAGGISNFVDGSFGDFFTMSILGGENNRTRASYSSIIGGASAATSLYGQVAHASGAFSARADAQAHELIWRRAVTGTLSAELFLDGASVRAILPGTNSIWHGTIDAVAVCTVTGDGSTTVGHVEATSYKVTIKRIGTSTSLVGTVQEIGTTNADASMATGVFSIDNDDTNEALRIRFTPPATAGSTTVIRAVATFRGTQIQY